MAIREIRKDGDEILMKNCREVTEFDEKLHTLLDDMAETMEKANGVGLAAPQVGVLLRAVVIETEPGQVWELINPEIIAHEGTQNELEGCLSLPGQWGITERPEKVTVRAMDRNGEIYEVSGEGLMARALCHELDHLDGVLYIDKMDYEIFDEDEEDDEYWDDSEYDDEEDFDESDE